jgi:hypothetical protein
MEEVTPAALTVAANDSKSQLAEAGMADVVQQAVPSN